MTSKAEERIWRTDDGRHVPDGHPDAAVLAYTPGDDVPKAVTDELEELRAAGQPAKRAAPKQEEEHAPAKKAPAKKAAGAPANKQARRPADK